MRTMVLFIACSLDGYIARENGDIDWLFTDQDYGYTDFLATVDTVLMGRRTYEQVLTFGDYPYKNIEGYVFSRTSGGKRDANVVFVSDDAATFINDMKQKDGKAIWLVGGSELIHACLQHDLIDEYVIAIHPIILGSGISLFRMPFSSIGLHLERCQTFDSGLVQITYARSADRDSGSEG